MMKRLSHRHHLWKFLSERTTQEISTLDAKSDRSVLCSGRHHLRKNKGNRKWQSQQNHRHRLHHRHQIVPLTKRS